MEETATYGLQVLDSAKQNFAVALKDAQSLDIVNNMASAFDAAIIVNRLEQVLTDEVMNTVFMPLMNKRTGFLTDRDPNRIDKRTGRGPEPYPVAVVRTAIIDAAMAGLMPMGNQFNIIAGAMYPAKAGYTALLQRMKASHGLVYNFEFDPETSVKSADPSYMAIPCRISYKTNRDDLKGWFKYVAMVKINGETSSTDQLRGKAERKCKKAFVEFLTGLDLGDADAADTIDVTYTEVQPRQQTATAAPQPPQGSRANAAARARELMASRRAAAQQTAIPTADSSAEQTAMFNPDFDNQGAAAQEGGAQ